MEIELRFKVKNLKFIENKLINQKAKLIKNKKQVDKYFGEINLYKKINYSFLLRIREEGNKVFLTYKGDNFKKAGVWQEYDFLIKDFKKAELMIKDMGFDQVITVKKKRREYSLDNLNVCLDQIEALGKFVEIEYLDKDSDSKKNIII
jgi:adenylate cyclase, class 2